MSTDKDTTVSGTGQRDEAEVLADAVRVLTEAARLRQPEFERDENGVWCEHPTHTRQADWAEFVTRALAGAAANVGSVAAALAGRPGSWEADAVRNLLYSTVGYDEQYLLEHRTEPLRVVVDVEQILDELDITWLYDDAEAALDRLEGDAIEHIDHSPYYWIYIRDANGHFVADDPDAPPWSIEAWRAALVAEQLDADTINCVEQLLASDPAAHASIAKSRAAARAAAQLAEQEDAIVAHFRARFEALVEQRDREWATYAEAFVANVRREADRRYPGIPVRIDVNTTPAGDGELNDLELDGLPEARLLEFAALHTPLPGSGIAPKDYPPGTSVYDAEKAAGRLPHLRLPPTPAPTSRKGGELHDHHAESCPLSRRLL